MPAYLLLLEDVEDLGRSGDVVSVKPGYARNFLLPKKKALIADTHTRRMQAKLQEERAKKAAVDRVEAEKMAASLDGKIVRTEVKVDHDGNMYGSVTVFDVLNLLKNEGYEIEKRFLVLPQPLKATGMHTVSLKLKEGVPASIKVHVVPEGYVEPVEAPAPAVSEESEE